MAAIFVHLSDIHFGQERDKRIHIHNDVKEQLIADLAMTACRCQDVGKILRRAAKAFDGDAYIARIASDLSRLDGQCRSKVERTISNIRSDWASKFDWRD